MAEEIRTDMTTPPHGLEMAISSLPSTQRTPAGLRPGAALYLVCVLALAAGGGLLGLRLLQTQASTTHAHGADGVAGVATPVQTSFGLLQVESIEQIRGLTPKALAGVTHGIQSLVNADKMQVQLVLALRNERTRTIAYDPAQFRLRVVRGAKSTTFESVNTSVRAAVLAPKSAMETTVGFVIPRFNPRGTSLALEFLDAGRSSPLTIDLGQARPGGSAADRRAAQAPHNHQPLRR